MFNQIGAETGRPSCTKPNLFNIPHEAEYRSCFIARKGWKTVTVDMAGAELRILAELTDDDLWIEAFRNDWDVHSIGAEMTQPKEWALETEDGCTYKLKKQKCKCKGCTLCVRKTT